MHDQRSTPRRVRFGVFELDFRSGAPYAGIHFSEGSEAGARAGMQIARYVVGHALRPLKVQND